MSLRPSLPLRRRLLISLLLEVLSLVHLLPLSPRLITLVELLSSLLLRLGLLFDPLRDLGFVDSRNLLKKRKRLLVVGFQYNSSLLHVWRERNFSTDKWNGGYKTYKFC